MAHEVGDYRARTIEAGTFRLDGGAMFGSVPRVLWERKLAPDALHRIPLATRLLYLERRDGSGGVLVDTGNGQKWDEASREQFAIEARSPGDWGIPLEKVTDLVLTHLHFDHAGGATHHGDSGKLEPTFPGARVHVQRRNWEQAHAPWDRERASYRAENFSPLDGPGLELHDGPGEILPGIHVEVVDGHTEGLQWLLVGQGAGAVAFPADLIPTSRHLHLPWIMGYDRCPRTTLDEKRGFLERAADEGWIVVFEHDPDLPAATVTRDARGRFVVADRVDLGGD